MGDFLLPSTFEDENERMLNSFYWGSKKNGGGSINWLRWNKMIVHKDHGGMNLCDLDNFNLAMLAYKICMDVAAENEPIAVPATGLTFLLLATLPEDLELHFVTTLWWAKTAWFQSLGTVPKCEATALLISLQMAATRGYESVSFDSDSQTIVNAVLYRSPNENELGSILAQCRAIFSTHVSFNLAFSRRQANRVAHSFARASIFQSDP
ncbi:60S ribosomal protein l23 [Trifolium pratense]|uniref:60S ribosomal protein l23 n=1 Tax=Trifolium pratense TaxID=57577 RepID=A0A2K3NMR6_TRIPR|nr:60S ribosomal protein l23 [Trifolium pratense]